MNKKDLVLSAINHKPVDVLPYDIFEGWMWPGPTEYLMNSLQADDYDDLLDKLGVYCRWVTANPGVKRESECPRRRP